MKWRDRVTNFLLLFFVMLICQLIADHVMRSSMDSAPRWFPFAVAAGASLFALLVVKLVLRKGRRK